VGAADADAEGMEKMMSVCMCDTGELPGPHWPWCPRSEAYQQRTKTTTQDTKLSAAEIEAWKQRYSKAVAHIGELEDEIEVIERIAEERLAALLAIPDDADLPPGVHDIIKAASAPAPPQKEK